MRSEKFRGLQKKVHRLHMRYKKQWIRELGNKCESCGSDEALQIHHHFYKLDYDLKNLSVYCLTCHVRFHKEFRRLMCWREKREEAKAQDLLREELQKEDQRQRRAYEEMQLIKLLNQKEQILEVHYEKSR